MKRPKQTKLSDQTPCLLIEVQGDTYDRKFLKEHFVAKDYPRYEQIAYGLGVNNIRILTIKDCLTNKVLTKKEKK
tara:strand:- start:195 stop:419 length:225 start_codon:yes stop_codon:yes gene_type:complete